MLYNATMHLKKSSSFFYLRLWMHMHKSYLNAYLNVFNTIAVIYTHEIKTETQVNSWNKVNRKTF